MSATGSSRLCLDNSSCDHAGPFSLSVVATVVEVRMSCLRKVRRSAFEYSSYFGSNGIQFGAGLGANRQKQTNGLANKVALLSDCSLAFKPSRIHCWLRRRRKGKSEQERQREGAKAAQDILLHNKNCIQRQKKKTLSYS